MARRPKWLTAGAAVVHIRTRETGAFRRVVKGGAEVAFEDGVRTVPIGALMPGDVVDAMAAAPKAKPRRPWHPTRSDEDAA